MLINILPLTSSQSYKSNRVPDGQYVVYRADQETDEVVDLFSVQLDDSDPPVKLNGPLVQGGFVREFQISPDSSRVVYLAQQETFSVFELYSVPLGGGALPVKLNSTLVNNGDVQADFQISPNSSRVIYRADQDTDTVDELFVTYDGVLLYLPLIMHE